MKLATINVIEVADTSVMSVNQLVSFADTPDGNKDAEFLFRKLIFEFLDDTPISEDELNNAIDDGFFESGTYNIALVHSTK